MYSNKRSLLLVIGLLVVSMLACNMPLFASNGDSAQGAESTSAAQTVEAQLTQMSWNPTATQAIPTATIAVQPTNTTAPTVAPTKTTAPTPTNVPVPCNAAQFIEDMTVADGAEFAAGTTFIKVWRLKNVGSCTWNKSYTVTFDGGDQMGGSTFDMPENVSPGEQIDVAIEMKAPNSKGTYKGYWLLRDDDGDKFGLGGYADKPFWVSIKVVSDSSTIAYDFAKNICNATWKTDNGNIYCQGNEDAYKNFVNFTTSFTMESGKTEDEHTILLNVAKEDRVRGIFPSYTVENGDHFISRIGCVEGYESCKVKVALTYKIKGTNTTGELGEWTEKYEGNTTLIDIDLSSLAGEEVIFTLDVSSLSTSNNNLMFWFVPGIRN
ncbi:hypothetical protein KQH54_01310 [bacterium]|nr:hypothetical protein [bacterium]